MKTAVVLFAYKRPEYLKKALASHTQVDSLDYYAFVDYSEMQDEILDIILQKGLYTVYAEEKNLGLNKNIITGISVLFRSYDAVIVLEDDLRISPDAIQYLHYQLWRLRDYKHFSSVCLSKGEIFNEFRCHGWGTWKDRWQDVVIDIDGESWDIQLQRFWKEKKLYCYASPIQRVKHIGNSGVHYKWYSQFGIRQYAGRVNNLIKRRFWWVG